MALHVPTGWIIHGLDPVPDLACCVSKELTRCACCNGDDSPYDCVLPLQDDPLPPRHQSACLVVSTAHSGLDSTFDILFVPALGLLPPSDDKLSDSLHSQVVPRVSSTFYPSPPLSGTRNGAQTLCDYRLKAPQHRLVMLFDIECFCRLS